MWVELYEISLNYKVEHKAENISHRAYKAYYGLWTLENKQI
jgi:hypothetical protein